MGAFPVKPKPSPLISSADWRRKQRATFNRAEDGETLFITRSGEPTMVLMGARRYVQLLRRETDAGVARAPCDHEARLLLDGELTCIQCGEPIG